MTKIRKFAALVILFLLCGHFNNIFAQENYYVEQQRTFYAGLIAGANFAQVDGDYFAGYYKFGANVGGVVYAQFAEHLAGSLEILYSQQGSKNNIERLTSVNGTPYVIQKYGINLNYAEIPVMINYFDKRKSHFGAGLAFERLAASTEQLSTYPSPPPVDLTKYPFKNNGLEAIAGAELHLYKGLFLNVRFQYSIIPIRTDTPPNFSRAHQFNNLWVVRFMYLFI
ncbi:MAG TPA: outer membrane beta-barrel protein [Flavipsychrobacter sp.]|nr:outer membrane beta-barrel protein [Flavipsychrobacter sp.]